LWNNNENNKLKKSHHDSAQKNFDSIISLICSHLNKRVRTRLTCHMSISSMLNVHIFCTNVQFGSFYYVHVTRKSCRNDVHTKNAWVLRRWNCRQMSILPTNLEYDAEGAILLQEHLRWNFTALYQVVVFGSMDNV